MKPQEYSIILTLVVKNVVYPTQQALPIIFRFSSTTDLKGNQIAIVVLHLTALLVKNISRFLWFCKVKCYILHVSRRFPYLMKYTGECYASKYQVSFTLRRRYLKMQLNFGGKTV